MKKRNKRKLAYSQLTLPGFSKLLPADQAINGEVGSDKDDMYMSYESLLELEDDDIRSLIVFLIDRLQVQEEQHE